MSSEIATYDGIMYSVVGGSLINKDEYQLCTMIDRGLHAYQLHQLRILDK